MRKVSDKYGYDKKSKKNNTHEIINLESMIPEKQFLRVIDKYFDWNFIYEKVEK